MKNKLREKQPKNNNRNSRNLIKKNNNSKNKISLKEQIFSAIYFELLGVILCLLLFFVLSGGKNYIKLYKDLNKVIDVYDTITTDYYGEIDKNKLIDAATEAMLNEIDDSYTTYTNEETTSNFLENIEGVYEGIGCTVGTNQEGEIYVASVFEDSPAKKAGMKKDDIILKIDNEDYKGKNSEDMSNYVRHSENKEIKFLIRRNNEEVELTIVREKIEVPSVTSKIIEKDSKKIGYIDIAIFSNVTYKQFKKELENVENKNIEGLIIDVRSDSGGYLSSVTDITSLFLEKGKVIYQLEDNNKKEKIKDETKEKRTYPIAVLINSGSASASEILASAIKESYNGFVIGINSYGKGTVQKTKTLSDGSMIKYTIQKWLTPKGNWVEEVGVEPTNYVKLSFDNNEDDQLNTAVNLIIEKLNN